VNKSANMALKVVISTAVARGYCFMREESVVCVVSSLVSLSLLTLGCCCSFAVPPPRGSAMKKRLGIAFALCFCREEEEEIASIELFGIVCFDVGIIWQEVLLMVALT